VLDWTMSHVDPPPLLFCDARAREALRSRRRGLEYRPADVFITRRGNRYADKKTITWAEATQERLCLLSEDMQNRRIVNKIAASAGLRIQAHIVSNSFLGVCSHLAQGDWSSIVPHTFSHVFGPPIDLVTVGLIEPVESQSIGLVLSDRDPLSPITGALMSIALKVDLEKDFALGEQG
jgi:DNA-binding transcriptional LysR family regulator